MKALRNLWRMVLHPQQTTRAILDDPRRLRAAAGVVLGFALLLALLFLNSHFAGDYPPPPDSQATWNSTWSEFAMLPFIKIPAERYRLAQALFVTPMILAAWILMAGSARLLSSAFGGRVTYEQYLALFAYSFFSFWILAHLSDLLYTIVLGDLVVPALRSQYGAVVKWLIALFPPVAWTVLLALGGIYNGIVVRASEGFSLGKCWIIAAVTFFWPFTLLAVLIR